MAKRKAKAVKAPHCKNTTRKDGTKRKICFVGGKIASAAKVKALRARKG